MNNKFQYDEFEIDPLENIVEKIHDARGGEMFVIHISEFGKGGPSVKICSAINKNNSIMLEVLQEIVCQFLNNSEDDNE